ncbi:hypothetical protein MYMA111404_04260 [Mycoplasma marinum]|uniref:Lipoprotein n=1 Tax=Mycoplasma marinum TaxID=1937190 RepID=A0A4R0XPY9_9MOLU|nr:hypothetical protein [Mycoplasma marinum]TCG10945.1 hypothetical protein C4B24_03490 [Mycoplasma marinum]
MKLNKKIMIGTLATTATLAIPIVAVVSCGGKTFSYSEGVLYEGIISDSQNINDDYKLLKKQVDSDFDWTVRKDLQIIMNSDGTLKDADSISDSTLEKMKYITLNVTYTNSFQNKWKEILNKIKKDYKTSKKALKISAVNAEEFTPEFFETLTDKSNAKKWSEKINNLYKQNKFGLSFNLVLPKELKKFDLGISIFSSGVPALESIQKEDSSIKVNGFEVLNAINFNIDSLPKELKKLYISENDNIQILNDSNFNLDKLPKNLKMLHIAQILTDSKQKEIDDYIQAHNLNDEKYNNLEANRIDNPESS